MDSRALILAFGLILAAWGIYPAMPVEAQPLFRCTRLFAKPSAEAFPWFETRDDFIHFAKAIFAIAHIKHGVIRITDLSARGRISEELLSIEELENFGLEIPDFSQNKNLRDLDFITFQSAYNALATGLRELRARGLVLETDTLFNLLQEQLRKPVRPASFESIETLKDYVKLLVQAAQDRGIYESSYSSLKIRNLRVGFIDPRTQQPTPERTLLMFYRSIQKNLKRLQKQGLADRTLTVDQLIAEQSKPPVSHESVINYALAVAQALKQKGFAKKDGFSSPNLSKITVLFKDPERRYLAENISIDALLRRLKARMDRAKAQGLYRLHSETPLELIRRKDVWDRV